MSLLNFSPKKSCMLSSKSSLDSTIYAPSNVFDSVWNDLCDPSDYGMQINARDLSEFGFNYVTKYPMSHEHGLHDIPELDPHDLTSQLLDNSESQMEVSSTAPSLYTDCNQTGRQVSPSSAQFSSPTVPSSAAYAGDYGFEVSVQRQMKETKSASWTYWERERKLYVRPFSPCPFTFRVARPPPDGAIIRALPIFMKPEHVQDVVKRCPNHMISKTVKESSESRSHIIKSDHQMALYEEDSYSGRLSIVLPHEAPQAGAEWVTNLFRFMCFTSCVGGLNRRPAQVVFSLEYNNVVLGRHAIEVRVCACPGRDRSGEERGTRKAKSTLKRTRQGEGSTNGFMLSPALDVMKREKLSDNDVFTLTVRGREHYETLSWLRDCLELRSMVTPQQLEQYRAQLSQHRRPAIDDNCNSKPIPPKGKVSRKQTFPANMSSNTFINNSSINMPSYLANQQCYF